MSTRSLDVCDGREDMNEIKTSSGWHKVIDGPFHDVEIVLPDGDKNVDGVSGNNVWPVLVLFDLHNLRRHDSPPAMAWGFFFDLHYLMNIITFSLSWHKNYQKITKKGGDENKGVCESGGGGLLWNMNSVSLLSKPFSYKKKCFIPSWLKLRNNNFHQFSNNLPFISFF